MDAEHWLIVVLLGAVMGASGQLLRAISGTIKHARVRAECPEKAEEFSLRQLVISSIVGAVAGVLAAVSMSGEFFADGRWKPLDMKVLLGLAAAGYAGADFIEATAGKYFGNSDATGNSKDKPASGTATRAEPVAMQAVVDGAVG